MTDRSNSWGGGDGAEQPSAPAGQVPSGFVPAGHFRASDGRVYPLHPPPPPPRPGYYRASDGNDYPERPPTASAPPAAPQPLDLRTAQKVERLKKKRKDPGLWLMTLVVVAMLALSFVLTPVLGFLALGCYTQYLAQRRGRIKTWPWLFYGMLLGPFAILHAALLRPTPEQRHEQARSKWAIDDSGLCQFVDGYASGPCLKRKDHVVLGLKKSPHDWRETARGQF